MKMIIILMLLATHSVQHSTVETIAFGHGGGFTGAIHAYSLSKTGELSSINVFQNTSKVLCTVDQEIVTELFKIAEEGELASYTLKDPGNTYKYVELTLGDRNHRMVWSGNSPNKTLNLLYTKLNDLCKSN